MSEFYSARQECESGVQRYEVSPVNGFPPDGIPFSFMYFLDPPPRRQHGLTRTIVVADPATEFCVSAIAPEYIANLSVNECNRLSFYESSLSALEYEIAERGQSVALVHIKTPEEPSDFRTTLLIPKAYSPVTALSLFLPFENTNTHDHRRPRGEYLHQHQPPWNGLRPSHR